ncbi:MAG: FHA domain-containing protein [Symploca sp. SIO1A3]|nr:FHA domain-containing protein [Symploca sp. SIO1A3]
MPQCPTCGATVSEQDDFCGSCGMQLTSSPPMVNNTEELISPAPVDSTSEPSSSIQASSPAPPFQASPNSANSFASITLRRNNILTKEVFQLGGYCLVGRFDPDTGPVDIDLGRLPEAEYVSRHHAEIRCDPSGQWFIKDLDTHNGTFFKTVGESKFKKVVDEQAINHGDEIALGNARFEFQIT